MGGSIERERRFLADLCQQPVETEWLEFKENLADPNAIGQYVSALANSAMRHGREHGYLVWGVRDGDHAVVGTRFDPHTTKVGNEDLIPWLTRLLEPQTMFRFSELQIGPETRAVILYVGASRDRPVRFQGEEFIRVGSAKKKLRDHPEHERQLWRLAERETFEKGSASSGVREAEILDLLDYGAYFDLVRLPLPPTRAGIVSQFEQAKLIAPDRVGWTITQLGAMTFAKDLTAFPDLERKGVRVVRYVGKNRVQAERSHDGVRGYANGFAGLMSYIGTLLPRSEPVGVALRSDEPVYPDLAVRELVANMMTHQDFSISGTGPLVEIFDDRIEFTNPGTPLISTRRFVDLPPHSRNEKLASLLRKAHIVEERGSGWDKIASEVERAQLPAPRIEVSERHTKAVLFGPKPYRMLSVEERTEALYLHATLRYVSGELTTNSSVRERFGIEAANSSQASRLLRDGLASGLLVLEDPGAGAKARRYLPFWAASTENV
ncbi:putative HTH transcriptional regulator [Mycolicibacterium mucogenicum 261Sha1.1M5]|nr:putative HTH transcriptional regulator [Mycolicibacterium mucogenicum 261Sha1.1M5]